MNSPLFSNPDHPRPPASAAAPTPTLDLFQEPAVPPQEDADEDDGEPVTGGPGTRAAA